MNQLYAVQAERSPDLDDAEVRRRLGVAYQIILNHHEITETADRGEFGDPARTAASDAPADKPEALDG